MSAGRRENGKHSNSLLVCRSAAKEAGRQPNSSLKMHFPRTKKGLMGFAKKQDRKWLVRPSQEAQTMFK